MASGPPVGPGGDEDTALLVAARKDDEAFEALYERNSRRVLAFFYRRILCPHTASELMAETFAQAYESRHRYDPAWGTGVSWIFGIAGNLYRDWLRHAVVVNKARRRLRVDTPTLVEEDLERIESYVDLTELRGALQEALGGLSPKVRDALLLRVAQDLPYHEVAERLGCSVGAARVRVSRGLYTLFEELERA